MRNIRKILALLLALFLTAALCGCAASRMDDGLAGTSGSDSVKPADATDFMSYAGPIFPLTLAQAAPIYVFTLDGCSKQTLSGKAGANTLTLAAGQVYIVKAGGRAYKVMAR